MQRLLHTTAAILAWTSSALAVRLRWSPNATPGAHLHNLAGERFTVNHRGSQVLLRVPPEPTEPALLVVSGEFSAAKEAPCSVYMDEVTVDGKWLGTQEVRFTIVKTFLNIKVSPKGNTRRAIPWRRLANYTSATQGPEAIPDTVKLIASEDGTGITLYAGPGELSKRPVVKVEHGMRAGVDVSLLNLQGLNSSVVAGLLGTSRHNRSLEEPSKQCREGTADMQKAATVENVEAKFAIQSTRLRNLRHETFTMNLAGSFPLLRVPKDTEVPALINVKGSFVSSSKAPCIVFLQRVAISGTWLGNNTAHVGSQYEALNIKVDSPGHVGELHSIKDFHQKRHGREAFANTTRIISDLDGPSFWFHIGEGNFSTRVNILITRTPHGGLDVKVTDTNRTNATEIGGLLGTDTFDPSLEMAPRDCEMKHAYTGARAPTRVYKPRVGPGSLLTASWTL